MTHNRTAGVIMSTQSLVLQKIKRDNGGNYTCLASNDRGETTSSIENLRVQCECDFHKRVKLSGTIIKLPSLQLQFRQFVKRRK